MLFIKKDSAWQFVTSSSGGIGVEFVLAEGGTILLADPSGKQTSFGYGAAGAGLSFGIKLPKVGKLNLQIKGKTVGGGIAPAAFPNTGKLYILDSFEGDELQRSDITGVCLFIQVGGGVIGGGSAYAMVLGMNPIYLAAVMASASMMPLMMIAQTKLVQSASSLLLMAGLNVAVQAGGGGGAFIGGLW